MIKQITIITNNVLSCQQFNKKYDVVFIEGDVKKVFESVRDYVHKGHKLLTHPLMSSVKPNETPYRTVIISKKSEGNIDMESLNYIEESMHSLEKFQKCCNTPKWSQSILEDFQLIDYDVIQQALN
ncbi:GrdX family protein [Clostridium oceanicum]|uniref:GrdX family protein n=1 Tax=Clostridium oceanicum TaxID=1543 RepID=A0ABP3UL10_9CLOT